MLFACLLYTSKISAIFSQIHLVAFEETVKLIQERLRILYRAAITNAVTLPDCSRKPKFVNLDMEEYRDLHLTAEAFKRTLMEDEFMHLEAGIVLQAYLPDSWEEQMKLCAWAKERVEPVSYTHLLWMSVFHVSLAAGRSGDNRGTAAGWQKTVASFLSGVSCIWFRRRNGTVLPEGRAGTVLRT